jgi:hypothetical protein
MILEATCVILKTFNYEERNQQFYYFVVCLRDYEIKGSTHFYKYHILYTFVHSLDKGASHIVVSITILIWALKLMFVLPMLFVLSSQGAKKERKREHGFIK